MARGDGTVSRSWLVVELAVGLQWWFDGKTVGMRWWFELLSRMSWMKVVSGLGGFSAL